jgi:hypothetical protein
MELTARPLGGYKFHGVVHLNQEHQIKQLIDWCKALMGAWPNDEKWTFMLHWNTEIQAIAIHTNCEHDLMKVMLAWS